MQRTVGRPARPGPAPPTLHGPQRDAVDAVLTASRALVAVAARSLSDIADEVTLPQYRALVVLAARGPQGAGALAEALDVSPSTATRMCDRLVRKRLVTRRTDRSDRRLVRLALTAAGRDLVQQVTERRRAEISRLLEELSEDEQRSVTASLSRLAAAAGELPERDWTAGWEL
jgi:DNA-binding MarR family transcriptional regulator